MNLLIRLNLVLLLLVAVFDPGDLITHLKVPLFLTLWILLVCNLLISHEATYRMAPGLAKYVFVFSILFPVCSILLYLVRNGLSDPYDGFVYLKSFLFLTLVFVIAWKRINLMPTLTAILTVLAVLAIAISLLIYESPALAKYIWLIGDIYGFVTPSQRTYADVSYSYVYFFTSPLLVLSLAYFTYRAVRKKGRSRYFYTVLLLINMAGMLDSGPRNNLVFGIATPLLVLIWYSGGRRRIALVCFVLILAVVAASYGGEVFSSMLDPENQSNAVKLAHLHDYGVLFSDPSILLFGQGLGSYFFASGFGYTTSITELTYLEFIRNFGLPIALVYFGMLTYPLSKLRDAAFEENHYLLLGYGCYLFICLSNPLLLSSSGMLMLAIVLYTVFPPGPVGVPHLREVFPKSSLPTENGALA